MANADLPRGFRPYGDIKHVGIYIAGGTIYPGDAVVKDGGAASTTRMRAQCVSASGAQAGVKLLGVAMNYATAGQVVRVLDDPLQLFAGQGDGSDFDSNQDLNLNADLLATAGSATYKVSQMEIDSSTLATTATLQVQVLGYVDRHDGKNAMGANAELIFKINTHQLANGADGV